MLYVEFLKAYANAVFAVFGLKLLMLLLVLFGDSILTITDSQSVFLPFSCL